jgi:hypothetical protein
MDGDGLFDEETQTVDTSQRDMAVQGFDKTRPVPDGESE